MRGLLGSGLVLCDVHMGFSGSGGQWIEDWRRESVDCRLKAGVSGF